MSEEKFRFFSINKNPKQWLCVPFFVAITIVLHFTVATNTVTPFWLENFGPLYACCIGGSNIGVVVALLAGIGECAIKFDSISLIYVALEVVLLILFDVYIKMGFFNGIKGILFASVLFTIASICLRTPINIACNGAVPMNNSIMIWLSKSLPESIPTPIKYIASNCIADFVDKIIIIGASYYIIKLVPENVHKWFCSRYKFPVVSIVTTMDEKIQAEKDIQQEKEAKQAENIKCKEAQQK